MTTETWARLVLVGCGAFALAAAGMGFRRMYLLMEWLSLPAVMVILLFSLLFQAF